MSKRKQLFAWLLAVMLLGGIVVLHRRSSIVTAEPVFRLIYGAGSNPIDGVSQVPIPNKGYLHAAVATDRSGNFYLLTSKQDVISKIPGVPPSVPPERVSQYMRSQQNIIHVLVISSSGSVQRAVPLRRLDGRFVRGYSEFLAVSDSGQRWWTLRNAHESLEDWKDRDEVEKRTVLLNAYDGNGKALGEWSIPAGLAYEAFVLSAQGNQAYVSLEAMEEKKQFLVYKPGQERPQQRPWPGSWIPAIAGSFITADGQFWHLSSHTNGNVESYVTQLSGSSRLFTTFRWRHKGFYSSLSLSLFWADIKIGLFVFERLKDEKGNIRLIDGAKAVYRITPDGQVRKLFETPDILPARSGEQVRAGQLLKADANFVWMEVEYLKGGKVTEYQIVKVPYQ